MFSNNNGCRIELKIFKTDTISHISWESVSSNVPTEQKFVDCILDIYLTQHCHEFTRNRDGQIPSLLDLVITKTTLLSAMLNSWLH